MKTILTIFKKELIDTLRDKRTLRVLVLIPLVAFPLIALVISTVASGIGKSEATRTLKVGYASESNDHGLRNFIEGDSSMELISFSDSASMRKLVHTDSLDLALYLPSTFNSAMEEMSTGDVFLFYNSSEEFPVKRINMVIKLFEQGMLAGRLDSLRITHATIDPVDIEKMNVASNEEVFGKLAGGFLPYIFVAFCFMGCMYPCIDMFTGEKERGSIETILSTPVERWKILVGKLSVVTVSGLITAVLALIGLFIAVNIADLPPQILDLMYQVLSFQFIALLLLMLIPLTVFFAGLMTPMAIYAKSFKEAQSMITPMNIAVVLPVMVGLLPGVELNFLLALIPGLNVSLATKDIIAGTLDPLLYAVVLLSLLAYAGIVVALSLRRFGSEKDLLRI